MHADAIDDFRHEHVFLGAHHERNERKTWIVVAICSAMMLLEIGGGILFHSMALVADGLHMSTHASALVIAALAYAFARRHARDERFTFGTGKVGDLAAFSSALILALIAAFIGWQSVERLVHPVSIAFDEAIPIAALGLGVNVLTAWLLRDEPHHHGHEPDEHDHHHDHQAHDHHGHDHEGHDDHDGHARHGDDHHHGQDLNLRAAYVHVAADAAVSVLAILGLTAGRQFGWVFMDPVMGIIGALVIANWSFSLIKATGAVLLDMRPRGDLAHEIEEILEAEGDRISDLHVWRLGPGHHAAVVSVITDAPRPPADYKRRLEGLAGLSHVTVEVELCPGLHAPRPGPA